MENDRPAAAAAAVDDAGNTGSHFGISQVVANSRRSIHDVLLVDRTARSIICYWQNNVVRLSLSASL